MADIVPETPAKPDTLPFVEPVAPAENKEKTDATDATDKNDKDDGPGVAADAPVSSGADANDAKDFSAAPSASATDAAPAADAGAAAAPAEKEKAAGQAGQVRDSTAPAHTKAQASDLPIETQPPKADHETNSAMAEAAKEDMAPVAAVADEAPAAKEAGDDVKKTDEEETRADGADKKEEAAEAAAEPASDAPAAAADGEAKPAKTPTTLARRKSVGQKLNRKGSKARIVNLDAKPGDHYYVKLKGYPAWPVIVCDEEMLPESLTKTRPVTAARADGTYREDYADGGKRATDRTFPVLYLYTYEFGWVPNQDMTELDPTTAQHAINDKMRKDLQQAHLLAAEANDLDYYKDLLRLFQEEREEAEEAKRQAAEAKRLAASTPKKSKKAKDEDVDMLDVPEDDDEAAASTKKSKKRKAEDDVRTPQRSDSVKKPKIKIMSSGTPKSNGTPSSTAKSKAAKSASGNGKAKQTSKASAVTKEAAAPAEPELDPEDKRRRKAKEVLFLRHKIQKGLLTRDQAPKEDEMKTVSDYLTKLEGFPDLEVGVIRETKINKVLKAILKIETIPREDEFKFKPRSHTLLEKWNKLLAAEPAPDAAAVPAANGTATTNGEAKANGVKKDAEEKKEEDTADKAEEKEGNAGSEPAAESDKPKEEPKAVEAAA